MVKQEDLWRPLKICKAPWRCKQDFGGGSHFFSMLVTVCANIPTTTINTRKKPSGEESYKAQEANPLTPQQFWWTLSLCVNFLDQGAVKNMPTPIAHPRDADLIILEQSLFCLFVCLS